MAEPDAIKTSSALDRPGIPEPPRPLTAADFIEREGLKVLRGYEDVLAALGLDSFAAVMAYSGGVPVQGKAPSSVVRLTLGSQQFYLKRYIFHPVRDFLRACFKLHSRINRGQEWENILRVQALGLPTVIPIAAGRQRRRGWLETCLLTLSLDPAQPLDDFVRKHLAGPLTPAQVRLKRALIRELAHVLRCLHEHGLHHQDPHLWHFFVQPGEGNPLQIILVDLMTLKATRRLKYTIKDLARLYFDTVWEVPTTRTDRLRFYKAYTGREEITLWDRWLFRMIRGKAWWMARRERRIWRRRGQEFRPRPQRAQM
jgi:heptose I phosphotransferase